VEFTSVKGGEIRNSRRRFEGVLHELVRLMESSKSPLTRKRLSAYLNKQPCRSCQGKRLRREILSVYLASSDSEERRMNIQDFCACPAADALAFMRSAHFEGPGAEAATEVIGEISSRLEFLVDVGLGYLQLNRESATLSGGKSSASGWRPKSVPG
jgi:excinuclease ABC subunit A